MWILIVVLLLIAVGALPPFGYSPNYYPSGGLGLVIVILLVLLLAGRI